MTIREYQGQTPNIDHSVYVDPAAILIGDVTIGADSSIWPLAVIRGDMHRIQIGARTSVQDGAVLHITHASDYNPNGYALTIGSEVTIGHQAILHGCTLHNKILIGMGAKVLDGAIIEDEVILGAGSLVPPGKRLQSGYLYVGTPAKPVRALTESELTFFGYTASNYVALKDHYMAAPLAPDTHAKQIQLEMQSAYQEATIQTLSQELYEQQLEIKQLKTLCHQLKQQVSTLGETVKMVGDGSSGHDHPIDEKPPHY